MRAVSQRRRWVIYGHKILRGLMSDRTVQVKKL